MSVGRICSREVITVERDATIQQAVALLREHHVGDLVVVDSEYSDSKPLGIITDRDIIIEIMAKEVPLDAVAVKDVMSDQLVTATDTDDLWEVLQRMRTVGVRRVPVVNASGTLVGILSTDDVIDLLAEGLSAVARLTSRQRAKEENLRP